MTMIAKAVEPLRTEAMKRTEIEAVTVALDIAKQMLEHGNKRNEFAPFPKSFHVSAAEFMSGQRTYRLVRMVTKTVDGAYSLEARKADLGEMSKSGVDYFVETARKNASLQYDAFIAKLESKVGEHISAELTGNHVWGNSMLVVTKADGSVQKWKTQMIVNVSKRGKMFNQFPTRLVK